MKVYTEDWKEIKSKITHKCDRCCGAINPGNIYLKKGNKKQCYMCSGQDEIKSTKKKNTNKKEPSNIVVSKKQIHF